MTSLNDRLDACAARVDALSSRFERFSKRRADAVSSQVERAHTVATKHGWVGGGTEERASNNYTHPKHPNHSLHQGKSFSRNLAWNHRINDPTSKLSGGHASKWSDVGHGLGIGSFEKHLSKFHGL